MIALSANRPGLKTLLGMHPTKAVVANKMRVTRARCRLRSAQAPMIKDHRPEKHARWVDRVRHSFNEHARVERCFTKRRGTRRIVNPHLRGHKRALSGTTLPVLHFSPQ